MDNAVTATMAFGGSTNAIPHLIAMARRGGFQLDLDRFDAISRRVPLIANLRPNGDTFLMEDFFYAGGARAFLARLAPYLDLSARTVTGATLGENSKAPRSTTRRSSARSTGRCRRRAASPSCAAPSPRAAPSSRPAPPIRAC